MNGIAWIRALRLRTLPLSASGIILGGFIAYAEQPFSWQVFSLTLSTALLLQILSNLANDYGDYTHGTDNSERIGPTRSVQSGKITPKQMKIAIIVFAILTFCTGLSLLFFAFQFNVTFLVFLLLGIASILAAIKYTVGEHNYGYKGFGDIMVFIFFGLVAVIGTYFLQIKTFNSKVLLPASAIGFFSMGVLNLNNMRDVENDKKSNKTTMVVKLGITKSKIYHTILISTGIVFSFVYLYLMQIKASLLILVPCVIFVFHVFKVLSNKNLKKLDAQLKILSLSTLLYSVLFGIIILI